MQACDIYTVMLKSGFEYVKLYLHFNYILCLILKDMFSSLPQLLLQHLSFLSPASEPERLITSQKHGMAEQTGCCTHHRLHI